MKDIFLSVLLIAFLVITPRIMYYICTKVKVLGFLGPSLMCFFLGIALSSLFRDKTIISAVSDWIVKFAIPFMLFSININSLKKVAKKSIISFGLICLSVMAVSILAGFLSRSYLEGSTSGIIASLSGLFIGGLLNMASVGSAAHLPNSTLSMLNTSYIVGGSVHLAITVLVLPYLSRLLLPPFDRSGHEEERKEAHDALSSGIGKVDFSVIIEKLPAFLLAVVIVGISTLLSYVITGSFQDQIIPMLGITTLAIAGSLLPKIRSTTGLYSIGQHFIDMFCLSMGLMISFNGAKTNNPLFYLILMVLMQLGAAVLHIIISRPFGIDADTTVMTGAAAIFSPSFMPPISHFLKNDDVLAIGLIYSILGFVAGNYIGFAVYAILSLLL